MPSKEKLIIIKVPRVDKLKDVKPNFPPLKNLHLDLLETKEKLKPGLPLIPRPKIKPLTNTAFLPNIIEEDSDIFVEETQEPGATTINRNEPKSKSNASKKKDLKREKNINVKFIDEDHQDDLPHDDLDDLMDDELLLDDELSDGGSLVDDDMRDLIDDESKEEIEDEQPNDEEEQLTPEELEEREKQEYIWKFRILKKQYAGKTDVEIPDYNEFSDITIMKNSYEKTIRELFLDDAVESYKTYLIFGWMGIELLCSKKLGIDMRGFTLEQIKSMYKYERMLIELGEKSYSTWGMNIPVELRLVGVVLLQAAMFYIVKMIKENYGSNTAEFVARALGTKPQSSSQPREETVQKSKKKMKGPSYKAEDIKKAQNKSS